MTAALDLLNAFGAARGLSDFAPDADGCAGVRAEGIAIDFRAEDDRLYVYSSLGTLPQGNEELVMTALLGANCAGSLGQGPLFALDPTLGDIVMFRDVDAQNTDANGLNTIVTQLFVDATEWRQRLQDIGMPTEEDAPALVPPHAMLRA
jgi:hypothetical protein